MLKDYVLVRMCLSRKEGRDSWLESSGYIRSNRREAWSIVRGSEDGKESLKYALRMA